MSTEFVVNAVKSFYDFVVVTYVFVAPTLNQCDCNRTKRRNTGHQHHRPVVHYAELPKSDSGGSDPNVSRACAIFSGAFAIAGEIST